MEDVETIFYHENEIHSHC